MTRPGSKNSVCPNPDLPSTKQHAAPLSWMRPWVASRSRIVGSATPAGASGGLRGSVIGAQHFHTGPFPPPSMNWAVWDCWITKLLHQDRDFLAFNSHAKFPPVASYRHPSPPIEGYPPYLNFPAGRPPALAKQISLVARPYSLCPDLLASISSPAGLMGRRRARVPDWAV